MINRILMESISKEKYEYSKTKKYILDLLNFLENIKPEDYIKLPEKLDYLIQASTDLGIPFIYFLLELKSKTEKNIGSFLIILYFEGKEQQKIEKLFNIIAEAFNYKGPKNVFISNPIEKEFLNNVENIGLLDNNENEQRAEGTLIENIYFKVASAIDTYNTCIGIDDDSDKGIKELKVKYDECRKDVKNLKDNKTIKNLKYTIDFFKELLNKIDFNKIYKKEENDINETNNDDNLSLSRSFSKNLSQHLEKIPLRKRTYFIINERIIEGEDLETEFKNYHFFEGGVILPNDLCERIKQLICGLLNNKGGRIYFGINDNKYVKGNKLTYKNQDDLRLLLLNLTNSFYPECKTSKISVHFIPIKDLDQKFLIDQYVTKVIVKQGDTDKLYSISNRVYESYIRLQGMVSQCSPQVIEKEIIERKNKPKDKIPDEEFVDPEPEKNLYQYKVNNYEDFKLKNNYNNERKEKRKKIESFRKNCVHIRVSNIDEETPIFILESLFEEYNDVILNSYFVEKKGLSLGYGFLDVKDMNSALKIIDEYNDMEIYGKKIRLSIKNK